MFEGNIAEKGEIAIPDIDQEVFTEFLRYLYTDTIELTVNTATSILSAARKYMVDLLVVKCETFLKSSLTTENVCLLLEQAHIHTEESLKKDCINMMAKSPKEVLKSNSFVDLCGVCVKNITESDDLAVEESVVYEAVMRWSEVECGRQGLEVTDTNRREVLGDIIYTVRFPIMDTKYVLQHVITRDVLTAEQLLSIQRSHVDNKAYPCTEFSVNKRKVREPEKGKFECINRFMDKQGEAYLENYYENDSISFVSTVDMFLHGLQLYGTYDFDQDVQIGVYSQDGDTLYNETHMVPENETLGTITFQRIIKITRGHTYTVVLHGAVYSDYRGTQGCSTVQCRDGQIRFMTSTSFPYSYTTVDEGQFPGLLVSFY